MSANHDGSVVRAFHDRTMHTPSSVRTSGHTLDWDIKPFPFKIYTDLPSVPLPRDVDAVAMDTLVALTSDPAPANEPLTLGALAALLYYSAGVTKKKTYPGGGEVRFRAAASTGALYQTEVYVAAGAVEGLAPGLYHFCPGDFTLRRLRDGDVRGNLAEAAADASIARRAATIVLTAIYWRNTWKYQARGYRHLFWDSGTMLANATAVGKALGLAPRVHTGFVDAEVNRLLALDPDHEAALELVTLGPESAPDSTASAATASATFAAISAALEEIRPDVMPLSSEEVDYPELRRIHHASSLESAADVIAWRERARAWRRDVPRPVGALTPLPARQTEAGRSLGETIQRRGSTRRFGSAPLTAVELSTALWCATRPVDADVPAGLVDLYLVVNAVDGIASGSYCYRPGEHALELLQTGDFRSQAAYLCLDQAIGGDAAVTVFFLAPLDAILASFSNRGYRPANLEAGRIGGGLYLAAYSQGFGASGLTFYDLEVVRFFSPHARGLDAIFVTALGRSAGVGSEEILIPHPSPVRRRS